MTGRLFKSKAFDRFASKENITDAMLTKAIKAADSGLIDADLGGGVVKQRIARQGEGKSGGYRTIIFYREGKNVFFQFGFAKNALDNVSPKELEALKKLAKAAFGLTEDQIKNLLASKDLVEVNYAKKISQ